MNRIEFLRLACLFIIFVITGSISARPERADLVFLGGKIYTVNPQNPWAETVAVRNGRIIYMGDEAGLKPLIGPDTKRYELGDRILLPGFIDTHVHPVLAAASMNLLTLENEDDLKTIYKKLKTYADDHNELPLIMGHGFNADLFAKNPTGATLDALVSDRPVFLIDSGGHVGWANTKAMQIAGITGDTPDPVPGSHYYVRDQAGRPTGYMFEEATFTPFIKIGRSRALTEIKTNTKDILPLMSSFGITVVFDASMEWFLEDGLKVLRERELNAELPFRFMSAMTVDRNLSAEANLKKFRALQSDYPGRRLRVGAVKFGLDGTLEGKSAALLGSYLQGGRGALNWEPRIFKQYVVTLDKGGLDLHIHAIGDRAVRLALDAIEAARKRNGIHGTRHTICHVEMIAERDIKRFAELDVIAQTTPAWHATASNADYNILGKQERQKLFRFNSLSKTGARVTFGSDFPYAGSLKTLIPAYNIEIGHTRRLPGRVATDPLRPSSEKLALETLIRGYTKDAAYQLRLENEIGTIEIGKRADLIILDRNPFDTPAEELHDIKVEMTMVDGQVVYTRPFYQFLLEWWLEI